MGQQYAYLTLIFYIAYMVAEIPLAYLMQRLHLGRLLSIVIIVWGALVMCLAACNSWAPLMVVRALLGLCEASVTPGFLLCVPFICRRVERPADSCAFLSSPAVSSAPGTRSLSTVLGPSASSS